MGTDIATRVEPAQHELDWRALPPPEPLQRALALADALPPGATASVLTPCWPAPLLTALDERGLLWSAGNAADGGVRVRFWRADART
jgi:hypothetical protein